MKYRIQEIDNHTTSPRPDQSWPTREEAEAVIREIEQNVPALKGSLEVVESHE